MVAHLLLIALQPRLFVGKGQQIFRALVKCTGASFQEQLG